MVCFPIARTYQALAIIYRKKEEIKANLEENHKGDKVEEEGSNQYQETQEEKVVPVLWPTILMRSETCRMPDIQSLQHYLEH